MAAYFADKAQPGVQAKYNANGDTSQVAIFSPQVALAVGDTITMMNIPPNTFLGSLTLDMEGVDSGTGLAVSVGQPANPGQFIQGGRQATAGTAYQGINQPGQLGYAFPPELMPETGYPIVITVTTAPATFTPGGNVCLRAVYSGDK